MDPIEVVKIVNQILQGGDDRYQNQWEQVTCLNQVEQIIHLMKSDYPDIKEGWEGQQLNKEWFIKHVFSVPSENMLDKSVVTIVSQVEGKVVSYFAFEMNFRARHSFGRMGLVSQQYRDKKILKEAMAIWEKMGRAFQFGLLWSTYTLSHPFSQMGVEALGHVPVGIIPAFDFDLIDGKLKFVHEVLHVKVLAETADLLLPKEENMSTASRELWNFLKPKLQK